MKRLVVPLFALLTLALTVEAVRAEAVVASPWLDFREAKVRLLAPRAVKKGAPLHAWLEVRLAPGYKTYWRNAGDSGVPPVFDFKASTGIGPVEVKFPFPAVFDDGAGGKAWGYKREVIFPIQTTVNEAGYRIALKLDFAVCGTMCIPLSGELRLDPAEAIAVSHEEAEALSKARASLPSLVDATSAPSLRIERQSPPEPMVWRLRLPYAGDAARFAAFAEAEGFLEIKAIEPEEPGFLRLTISGQAAPGTGGRFGPVRLTYGAPGMAFERMLDLDAVPAPR